MTRGPAPKPGAIRRNAHPHAQQLEDTTQPARLLPASLGIKTKAAKDWWKTWSTAPQTAEWSETDWAELEITVKLVDAFYQGETKHASEIRMRTAKWGATVEDRARLRMELKEPDVNEGQGQEPDEAPPELDMDQELYKLLNE